MIIENFTKMKHYSVAAKNQKGNGFELVLKKDQHLSQEDVKRLLQHLGNRTNLQFEKKLKKEEPQKRFVFRSFTKLYSSGHSHSGCKDSQVQNL
ncbi:hypothetical protein [Bacillus stratosphericus]|uniref:hypothetical protein n=1 Tax=Bacillus stratosphericus TaxID=293386 RepID=UPI001CFAA9D4|nr:hypothetical protein [Bacillus stratosphericus]